VHSLSALADLKLFFEQDLEGAGCTGGFVWTDDLVARVPHAIVQIRYWSSDDAVPGRLVLDTDRVSEMDELGFPL
jgi:hypothetical protein